MSAKSEDARSVVLSDLTVAAAVSGLPEEFLVGLVMTLTGGTANPEIVRIQIQRRKIEARKAA